MNTPHLIALERLFLALGDKTRLRLLSSIAAGPVSVGHLVDSLGESQPKISRHLAYMRQSGLVVTQRDGKWIYYALAQPDEPEVADVRGSVIAVLSEGGHARFDDRAPERKPTTWTANDGGTSDEFPDTSVSYQADADDASSELQVGSERDELEVFLL